MKKRECHRRHRDWECFDHISLDIVPRYKTSGLSGDEWRFAVHASFWFKGEKLFTRTFRDMQTAVQCLGGVLAETTSPIPKRVIELEHEGRCDQPGCAEPSVSKYRFKRIFGRQGEDLADSEMAHASYFAQFCARHLRRGDCGREDADENYEVISGPGPDDSTNLVESPAIFGGYISPDLK